MDERGRRVLAVVPRSLATRGLGGMELVTSDAHHGLKNAIAAVFAGRVLAAGKANMSREHVDYGDIACRDSNGPDFAINLAWAPTSARHSRITRPA